MASTTPVQKQVNEGQQRLTGDSFIRPHLRNLSPYQPILPFEVFQSEHNFFPSLNRFKVFFLEFWRVFLRKKNGEWVSELDLMLGAELYVLAIYFLVKSELVANFLRCVLIVYNLKGFNG